MEKKYLTIEEVAKIMRVNKRTVYRLAESGKLPAFRFGRAWRIDSVELQKLFKSNTTK